MSRLSKAMMLGVLSGISGVVICLFPFGLDLEENIGLYLFIQTQRRCAGTF